MKTNSIKLLIVAGISAFCLLPSAFGQGALTPPGAPALTMKTLARIELCIPISSAPFTISAPGSYYLTTNLTGVSSASGITISSGNVTLDLNGFALQGVSGSLDGVRVDNSYTNITVRNGTITGWGWSGVETCTWGSPRNLVFERLTVSANGRDGIRAGTTSLVRDCCCSSNHLIGIYCYSGLVSGCAICNNGELGIRINNGTVSGCYVANNALSGILTGDNGCQIIGNNCFTNNTSSSTIDAGILVYSANNRIEDNHVTSSGYAGIQVINFSRFTNNINNIVVKNTVIGDGANNYITRGNQIVGPLITTYGTITNSNPWANFSF